MLHSDPNQTSPSLTFEIEVKIKDEKNNSRTSNSNAKPYKDLLNFKLPKETQLVTTSAIGPSYSKSYH